MIKYFDIFAGIGGFRSGLEPAHLSAQEPNGNVTLLELIFKRKYLT